MGKEVKASVKTKGSLKNAIQKFETLRRAAVGNTNKVTGGIMVVQYLRVLTLLANSLSLRKGDFVDLKILYNFYLKVWIVMHFLYFDVQLSWLCKCDGMI